MIHGYSIMLCIFQTGEVIIETVYDSEFAETHYMITIYYSLSGRKRYNIQEYK